MYTFFFFTVFKSKIQHALSPSIQIRSLYYYTLFDIALKLITLKQVFNAELLHYISFQMADIVIAWLHFAGWCGIRTWVTSLYLSALPSLPKFSLSSYWLIVRETGAESARWLAVWARMICSEFSRSTSDVEWVYKTVWASHPILFLITHKLNECVIKVLAEKVSKLLKV